MKALPISSECRVKRQKVRGEENNGWMKRRNLQNVPNDGRRRKQRQRPDVFNDFTGLVSAESALGVYRGRLEPWSPWGIDYPTCKSIRRQEDQDPKWGPGTSGKQHVRQTNLTEIHQRFCLFLACPHPSAGKFHHYFRLTQSCSDPRSTMQFNVNHRQDIKRIIMSDYEEQPIATIGIEK